MKRFLVLVLAVVSVGFASLFVMASRYEKKARPGSVFENLQLGGMARGEVEAKISGWWKSRKGTVVLLEYPGIEPLKRTFEELGVGVDVKATADKVPFDGFWHNAKRIFGGESHQTSYEPVYVRGTSRDWKDVAAAVKAVSPARTPARVLYKEGQFERVPEVTGVVANLDQLSDIAYKAAIEGRSVQIPVIEAPKKVSDRALQQITDVVSEVRTTFNSGQVSRSSNIALAAAKLDGIVLAPGEQLSFNGSVGRRTAERGFKVAGVYANGRHEVDLGGGICQVSSTLYNAALVANLKIVRRVNHSMPVPYLPVGRDATVDYGTVDLVIENNFDVPIAVDSEYSRGALTFRILGKKDPGLKVEIASDGASSWSLPIKRVPDSRLPAGKEKVIEKGSRGYAINTYRVVYRDGVEVSREPLGKSHYRGGSKIVAVGTRAVAVPEEPVETEPQEEEAGI